MAITLFSALATDVTLDAGGSAVSMAVDSGSGTDRFLQASLAWNSSSGHSMATGTMTYNATSLTAFGAQISTGGFALRCFYLALGSGNTGSNTLSCDPSNGAGASTGSLNALVHEGVDQATPFDGYTSASTTTNDSTAELTITSAVGDVAVLMGVARANTLTGFSDGGTYVERYDNLFGTSWGAFGGDAAGAASVATVTTLSAGAVNGWAVMGWNLNAASGGGGGTYPQAVGGALSPAGTLVKRTSKFSTGAFTPSAVLSISMGKSVAGAVSSSAVLVRRTDRSATGTLSPQSTTQVRISKLLAGSISPASLLETIKVALRSYTGEVGFAGSVARQPDKSLSGALSSSATLLKRTAKPLEGSLTPSGSLVKRIARAITAALSFSSLVAAGRSTARSVAGALGFTGEASGEAVDTPEPTISTLIRRWNRFRQGDRRF